jgi:iron(III) transport system permease protein
MPPDALDGLALRPLFGSGNGQKAGLHGWIQRALIALACLWLLVGVLLPLAEVAERATRLELPVRIEEPTESEKAADDFRGQVSLGGYVVLLMKDGEKHSLYLNNKISADGTADGLSVTHADGRLTRVVLSRALRRSQDRVRMDIAPLVVDRDDKGRWRIDGHLLPLGERVRVVRRFIGIGNFMDYFGLENISQSQTLLHIALLLASGWLWITLLLRIRKQGLGDLGRWGLAILLLLLAQIVQSAQRLAAAAGHSSLAASSWNSLAVAFTTMLISVTLAFVFAYGLTRTCMKGKTFFRLVAMLPLFAPTMLFGLSLVYLFGNQGLVTTGFFGKLPWLAWDIGLYGFRGIVIAEVAFTFPPAMMILSVALSQADARLYEAADSLGSSPLRTFFMVTLPGVKYGLLSAVFVCFTLSFTDFGAPKVVGGRFNVLAVDIYKQVVGQQNFGMGATVSMILLAPTLLAFIADRIVQKRSHAALTARSVPLSPKPLLLRDAVFTVLCSLVAGLILLVLFTAGLASFVNMWPYAFSHPEIYPDLWTAKHYRFDGVGGGGYRAFFTSLRMSAWSAAIGTAVTFVSAYLIEKTKGAEKLRQGAYFLSIIPLALPGLVIGIAYVFFFNRPTLGIPFTGIQFSNPFNWMYGTMALLVLSNIIHFYTVSFLTATTALKQLDKEFELVSESMAVPFYRTFFRVTVPVCFPAIVEIAAYYFVSSMATVSAVIFLYTSRTPLASVAVVNMDDAGDTAAAAAMCMLIVGVNILIRLAAEALCALFARKTQAWRRR